MATSASWISVHIAAWEAVRDSIRESGMSVKPDIWGGDSEVSGEDRKSVVWERVF